MHSSRAPIRPATVGPFVPLIVVSVVHLVAILFLAEDAVVWTKPLLMPALALALIWSVPNRRSKVVALGVLALTFSWLGDMTLRWFVIGLACFLIAHLTYLVLFTRSLASRKIRWWALSYAVWLVALLVVLAPYVQELLIPVILYGIVLSAMAAVGSRCNKWIAIGGGLFVASDSLLALSRFVLWIDIPLSNFLIMLTYIAAQTFIVWGIVRHERSAAARRGATGTAGITDQAAVL